MVKSGGWRNLYHDGPHAFAGRCFCQNKDVGFVIDRQLYNSASLVPSEMRRGRMSEEGAAPTDGELRKLRFDIRGVGWVSRQCRPEHAAATSLSQSSFSQATMKDIADASVAVRRFKATKELCLRVEPIPLGDARIVGISEGSFDTDKATRFAGRLHRGQGAQGPLLQHGLRLQNNVVAEPQDQARHERPHGSRELLFL